MELSFIEYNRWNNCRARKLRKNTTPTEDYLRDNVLKYRPLGYKFTRQKPLDSFIVDFYCAKLRLAIEVDGEIHKYQKQYDLERDTKLYKKWVTVVRYQNKDVLNNKDQIYKSIIETIKKIINIEIFPPCEGRARVGL